MFTKRQFQAYYFRKRLKDINFQLREMEAAPDADRLNHSRYVAELLHSCTDEFNHVVLHNEAGHGPVHEVWENYCKQFTELDLENYPIILNHYGI